MKIKVSNATNTQLDWLVTDLENLKRYGPKDWLEQRPRAIGCRWSTNWEQGGPIIEREGITIARRGKYLYSAWGAVLNDFEFDEEGSTPLVAAMRCYVAFRLGDEVEIPKELI